eukprot:CAMPEP_0169074132 /NCGR_PEP_ID=MMETSP1015-20121227/7110_1 /TAXON_ID=342587 /ORGANISM="Karlodinium micrum, Strain CCMP2283" /LENGTH=105 /DNA_ID=CAMNT_0009133425 /DNA_START=110 /DNA_END=427 /DNA_ORIENTATION=+
MTALARLTGWTSSRENLQKPPYAVSDEDHHATSDAFLGEIRSSHHHDEESLLFLACLARIGALDHFSLSLTTPCHTPLSNVSSLRQTSTALVAEQYQDVPDRTAG